MAGVVSISSSGDFSKMNKFLKAMAEEREFARIEEFASRGVEALAAATPVRTGATAASWDYTITRSGGDVRIDWTNSNEHDGFNVAIGLQYGHGTGTGGYVPAVDYINPVMKDVFQQIADEVWGEVERA